MCPKFSLLHKLSYYKVNIIQMYSTISKQKKISEKKWLLGLVKKCLKMENQTRKVTKVVARKIIHRNLKEVYKKIFFSSVDFFYRRTWVKTAVFVSSSKKMELLERELLAWYDADLWLVNPLNTLLSLVNFRFKKWKY